MPKDKDRKRLARARMKKTGESYTAARAQILRKKEEAPAPGRTDAELAALGGQTDATMRDKTGRAWRQWVALLDEVGAHRMSHTDIARHLHDVQGVPGWWAQTVTVGYERIRGLREVGQRRGGLFEAGKSKTYPVALAKLYAAFSNARTRARWLPGLKLTIRTTTANKSMRLTWPDGTSVLLAFEAKGPAKSTVALVHMKLPSKAAIADAKAFWAERLAVLGDLF